jgi:hypothetical protein
VQFAKRGIYSVQKYQAINITGPRQLGEMNFAKELLKE